VRELFEVLVRGQPLSREQARTAMAAIMDGEATPSQIGGLLMALAVRGETVEELVGFAEAMRERVERVPVTRRPVLDTCGTGGDGSASLNVSTLAGLVAAAAGIPVAKHGNRSVSSRSGSADLLEALGVRIPASAAEAGAQVDRVGFGFLYAPLLHPSIGHAMPTRRELGVRTVFNLLGPLTNPAGAEYQLLGVFRADWVGPVAEALARLGTQHSLVVHGDGLDEATLSGPTLVAEVRDGRVTRYELTPEVVGLSRRPVDAIRGGDPRENARRGEAVLAGVPGPDADFVALNAGLALYAAGAVDKIADGVEEARRVMADGRAERLLFRLRAWPEEATA
jgi:anthranilate phosphoribosyltransferase